MLTDTEHSRELTEETEAPAGGDDFIFRIRRFQAKNQTIGTEG